jgi:hypothetical protein
MYNWTIIWSSRGWNTDFRPIFTMKRHFSVKPKASPFEFWFETRYFSNPQKIVNNLVMFNWARIWAPREWNMNFRPVFTVNKRLSVKPKANPFGFWVKTWFFKNLNKIVYNAVMSNRVKILASRGWNTDFWPIFIVKRRLSIKLKANPFGFFTETRYFSTTQKNCVRHYNV